RELWQVGLLASEQASHRWFRQLQSTGRARVADVRVSARTGEERHVIVAGSLYDEGGFQMVICEVQDITEKQKALEYKMLLAAIVESSDDSIVSILLNGTITSWNAAAERLYGYSAKEIVGKPLTTLTLEEDFKEVLARVKRIGEGREVEVFETFRVHKEGQEIRLSIKLSAVRNADGRIVGVSTHARDISEEKRLNLELQQSFALLEKRVEERTSELKKRKELLRELSRRLVDSQEEEARRIGLELHDSIGGALTAHKLQIIRASARDFESSKEKFGGTVSQIIGEMRQICRRLHPSVLRDFGVKEGLRFYIEDFQERTGIKVRYRWSEAVATSLDTREQVSFFRVVQESLTNVAKHSGSSEVQVAFHADGQNVWVEVIDQGAGFNVGTYERQSHGLSGMLERMTLLGGQFEITSKEGGGTRVFASFPRRAAEKQVTKRSTGKHDKNAQRGKSGKAQEGI
ncbi:MAG: PAS domain-containing sensor histidine kinase, partial [Limisphaerales bacterium]